MLLPSRTSASHILECVSRMFVVAAADVLSMSVHMMSALLLVALALHQVTCSALQHSHSLSALDRSGLDSHRLTQKLQSLGPHRLRERVCKLLLRLDVVELDLLQLYLLANEVVPDVDVLCSRVVPLVVFQCYRSLIVFSHYCWLLLVEAEILHHRVSLKYFLGAQTKGHVLSLSWAQGHCALILGVEGDRSTVYHDQNT